LKPSNISNDDSQQVPPCSQQVPPLLTNKSLIAHIKSSLQQSFLQTSRSHLLVSVYHKIYVEVQKLELLRVEKSIIDVMLIFAKEERNYYIIL